MKFCFFSVKGEKLLESENLKEVESRAREYKEQNKLSSLQICTSTGKFFKWI